MSKHHKGGRAWQNKRRQILERDMHICAYCGDTATVIDHIHPVSRGGSDEDNNLVSACVTCNRTKSDKTLIRTQWVAPSYRKQLNKLITSTPNPPHPKHKPNQT